MTAIPKFAVGDVIRCTEYYPNNTLLYTGNLVHIQEVDTSARFAAYKGMVIPHPNGYGNAIMHGSSVTVTGSKFELFDKRDLPAPPKPFADLTKEELAKRVVEISKRYAKRHDWCDVVESALREIGLEDFMTVTKTVTIEVEVRASATDEQVLAAATENISAAEIE